MLLDYSWKLYAEITNVGLLPSKQIAYVSIIGFIQHNNWGILLFVFPKNLLLFLRFTR